LIDSALKGKKNKRERERESSYVSSRLKNMACARLICRESTQNLMHKWALQCKQASQRFGSSTLVSLSLSLSLSQSWSICTGKLMNHHARIKGINV
jgi:hypothetical protein